MNVGYESKLFADHEKKSWYLEFKQHIISLAMQIIILKCIFDLIGNLWINWNAVEMELKSSQAKSADRKNAVKQKDAEKYKWQKKDL